MLYVCLAPFQRFRCSRWGLFYFFYFLRTTSDGAVFTTTLELTTTLVPGETITATPFNVAASPSMRRSSNVGAIVGGVLGALAFFAVLAFGVVWLRKRKVGREFDDGVGGGGEGQGQGVGEGDEGAARVTPFNPFEEGEMSERVWDPGPLFRFAPMVLPEPDDRGGHARKSEELSGTSSSGSPVTQSHHRRGTVRTVGARSMTSRSSYSQRSSGEEREVYGRGVRDASGGSVEDGKGRGVEGRVRSPSASTAGSGPAASRRREGQGVGEGEGEEVVEIPPTYDSIPSVERAGSS
jgi:hypothetical protein